MQWYRNVDGSRKGSRDWPPIKRCTKPEVSWLDRLIDATEASLCKEKDVTV